jgi:hypothetical protein
LATPTSSKRMAALHAPTRGRIDAHPAEAEQAPQSILLTA